MVRRFLEIGRTAADLCAGLVGFRHSENRLQQDANKFWGNSNAENFGVNSHWRGHGIFKNDDPRWYSIGNNHRDHFFRLANATASLPNAPAVLEWGCGGGANAVAFAPISSRYVGVDISQGSIDECMRQLALEGNSQSLCLLVDIGRPEGILSKVEPVDVVVCTYVFELLPSKAYALRLVQVFFGLLKPGGVAFIQIRYATAKFSTSGRSWGYGFGFTKMVSFFLDEFWKACEIVGFSPKCLTLVPTDSTVFDERYAYFLLEKPLKA